MISSTLPAALFLVSKKLAEFSIMRAWLLVWTYFFFPLVEALGQVNSGGTIEFDSGVQQFINSYCIKCHGPDEEKGDRTFHKLAYKTHQNQWKININDPQKTDLLHDILDQLNLGEMPPRKKGVNQPGVDEIRKSISWLTDTLLKLENQDSSKETVLRRLNRREYQNSLSDLLGLNSLPFDFTDNFPKDDDFHGFSNLGSELNLSDQHFDAYLDAADRYLRMAFRFSPPIKPRTIQVRPQDWGYPERVSITPWMYRHVTKDKYLDIGAGKKQLSDKFDLGTFPHTWFDLTGGIQVSGYYKLTVSAEAIRRLTHPYDPKMIPTNLNPPMQLGVYLSRGKRGIASDSTKSRSRIGLWDLSDHQKKTFEVVVWMDQGDAPFLNWDNGPGPSDYWMRDICEKYHTDIEFRGKQGSHAWHVIGKNLVPGRVVSDVWKGPVVRVHDLHIHGPLNHTFSSKAQNIFLGGEHDLSKVDLSMAISRFATQAFRRPLSPEEIRPYLNLEKKARLELKRSPQEAFFLVLKAMLVSPDFLYLKEISSSDSQISNFELANRLSFFLWSSIPDDTLFKLAKEGKLKKHDTLEKQVLRMIRDPRSRSFVEGFAEAWLRLDKLGTMPPASLKFQEYYRYGLEEAMLEETHLFLANALQNNAKIDDFIHSKYGFINQDLARHYGIDDVTGIHFRKVSFPNDGIRGGLLGQASVLTLSANGVDTSPVVRGIWVLESLLGTPPAPPPPDVEPINPDVRGAKTVKQLLSKHRTVQACADCHAKIDPLGFPLEYFDPVGGFRPTYYRNRSWKNSEQSTTRIPSYRIDGSSTLISGEFVDHPKSLKNALSAKKKLVVKNLAEKLLSYGSGRLLTLQDTTEMKRTTDSVSANNYGFRDLIIKVVTSEAFVRK